jgi:hypothetical protein
MEKQITLKNNTVMVTGAGELLNEGTRYTATYDTLRKSIDVYNGTRSPRHNEKLVARGTRGQVMDALDAYRAKLENVRMIPAKGKGGRIVRSGRLFGVELELTRGGETIRKHVKRASGLTLKHDGSVNGESLEITTPPMSGSTAEYVFNTVLADAVTDSKTDTSCGMHIHVDARDFARLRQLGKHEAFVRLVRLYASVAPFMKSVVPHSRRENSYTRLWNARGVFETLSRLPTDDARVYIQNDICQDDRYQWFNLVPFYKEGHYEVRLHGGTHDTRKILEWANLHTLLADGAMHKWFTLEDEKTMLESGSLRTLEVLTERLRLSPQSVTYWRGRISRFNA